MVGAAGPDTIRLKRKAISALFPYAILQEQGGQNEMFDVLLRVAKVSMQGGFIWHHLESPVTALLDEERLISLKRTTLLVSPHIPWQQLRNGEHLVRLWAAAASAVPYTDDIGQSVVDTLLQIAHLDPLSPHIPVAMWSWLNKRPSLHPICWGRYWGTDRNVLRSVRTLSDIRILKSYLLLVWSEWDSLWTEGFDEMCTLIQEDFSGIGMGDHRQDLLQHLDCVLERLDLGLEHLQRHKPSLDGGAIQWMKAQYGKLERILLEVDERARTTLTRELLPGYNPSQRTNSYFRAEKYSALTNSISLPRAQLGDRNAPHNPAHQSTSASPNPPQVDLIIRHTPSRPARRPRTAALLLH